VFVLVVLSLSLRAAALKGCVRVILSCRVPHQGSSI
jgi:hypothetical protein